MKTNNVNYHLLKNSLVVSFDGRTFNLHKSDMRFNEVVELINTGKLSKIPDVFDDEKSLKLTLPKSLRKFFTIKGNELFFKGEAIPSELYNKVVEYRRHKLPFKHILLFWMNLKMNPSFNSREQLFKFLEHNGHPITQDGCFIAYRSVNLDFKDWHTGKMDNRVGKTVKVSRSKVDDNPNNTCSHGLHVAAWQYASTFRTGGHLVEVKVNPKDVVAVPTDYDGTKMRVCEFKVIRKVSEINMNLSVKGV